MKIFTTILMIIASGLLIFNLTLLNLHKPLEGNSMIALVGSAASFCAILILLIFKMSKKIEEKLKN